MQITHEVKEQTGIVHIVGPLTAATSDELRRNFWPWYPQSGAQNVVLDLGGMDVMDSTGLGTLIGALKLVGEKGHDIKIAALQKRPRLVFEITRSYKVFEIFDTVDEALNAAKK